MGDVREGVEVEFGPCGHRMVYDKFSDQGQPELGQVANCRLCADDDHFLGMDRTVVGLRQCWIETTTAVHFEQPADVLRR